jgi:16S rRNA processing protein RimM
MIPVEPMNDKQKNNDTGSPKPGEPEFIVIGKLRRPHGVDGEMILELMTDFPNRIRPHKTVFVGKKHEPIVITGVRPHDKYLLLKFEGMNTCDEVGRLRNFLVYVRFDSLPKLPAGEYYFHQLMGLTVVDESGTILGVLEEILETGANNVYVVRTPDGKEILLPAIEPVILSIDIEGKEMRVKPPEWG